MNERYELRTGDSRHGKWEVAHHWADGITVQVRYFATRKDAVEYLRSKGMTRK